MYLLVERDKKVKEEQRYEKSIEVDQKTKQIGVERTAIELLINALPAVTEGARVAMAELTFADYETGILNNSTVPEAIQVSARCCYYFALFCRTEMGTEWWVVLIGMDGGGVSTSLRALFENFTDEGEFFGTV